MRFLRKNYNSTLRDEGAGNFYDDNYNRNTRWDKLYYLAESATTIVDGIRRSPVDAIYFGQGCHA